MVLLIISIVVMINVISDSVLSENFSSVMIVSVFSSDIGIVSVGISVVC